MVKRNAFVRTLLAGCVLLQSLAPSAASAGNPIEGVIDCVHNTGRLLALKRPDTSTEPYVEQVAREIDWLEHEIETFGTVVPKQPDVWGEARLTTHRQEVERVLAARLNQFGPTLQGQGKRMKRRAVSGGLFGLGLPE